MTAPRTDVTIEQIRPLVGNLDAYALQDSDGSYKPVREPLTDAVLKRHLAGAVTVGTYTGWGDLARTLIFDLDEGNNDETLLQAEKIVSTLMQLGCRRRACAVEFSGRKGFHVWFVLEDYVLASELRRLGAAVLALTGIRCEVNPKQDEVRDLGNLVKLPGGLHRVTDQRAEFLSRREIRPMTIDAWQSRVLEGLPKPVQARGPSTAPPPTQKCLDILQTEGVEEGYRNNGLFHLAVMLRRAGVSQDNVRDIVEKTNAMNDPIEGFEIDLLLRSSQNSGPVCSQLPAELQCGEDCVLVRYQAGLFMKPGALKNAAAGEKAVVEVSAHDGDVVALQHPDLTQAKGRLR